jgi:hypothetical protein
MPRSPKGRAAARGLDARLRLQHAYMPAGDASLKTAQLIKMLVDSNHGIYREPDRTSGRPANVCFSNRSFEVKRFRDDPPPQFRCRSRAHASLRNRRQGPSIMGFEDEVEQSMPRPLPLRNGRSKRTCELTSSIVPRGTSFHRLVETRVSFYWI